MVVAVVTSAGAPGRVAGGASPRMVWADRGALADAIAEIDTMAVISRPRQADRQPWSRNGRYTPGHQWSAPPPRQRRLARAAPDARCALRKSAPKHRHTDGAHDRQEQSGERSTPMTNRPAIIVIWSDGQHRDHYPARHVHTEPAASRPPDRPSGSARRWPRRPSLGRPGCSAPRR